LFVTAATKFEPAPGTGIAGADSPAPGFTAAGLAWTTPGAMAGRTTWRRDGGQNSHTPSTAGNSTHHHLIERAFIKKYYLFNHKKEKI
jgi:hypothetical protein